MNSLLYNLCGLNIHYPSQSFTHLKMVEEGRIDLGGNFDCLKWCLWLPISGSSWKLVGTFRA